MKTLRLKLLIHVNRMEYHGELKAALQRISGVGRRRGKPRNRWLDDHFRKIGVKRWRIKGMDRTKWRKICEAAKVLQEL
jgi:hypothetical protein